MDPDRHAQDQDNAMQEIPHGLWVDGGNPYHSHHQSPSHEYNGFQFSAMSMGTVYASNMPPPPRTAQQQLHPLVTTPWPSMLTSQSNYGTPIYHAQPVTTHGMTTPVVTTPMSAPPTTGRSHDRPRRTLTDDDRRRMCKYAEANPNVKQTEIGNLFGVERSTVSKVLRNREKYLAQPAEEPNSKNQAKGKYPDIERTLSNWVRNEKKTGGPITDDQIMEKFRHFARTVSPDQHLKSMNNSWLEMFKQKNGLSGPKSRKSSIAGDTDDSGAHSPNNLSPTSPNPKRDASPAPRPSEESLPKKIKSESPPASSSSTTPISLDQQPPPHTHSHSHRPYASISSALSDSTPTPNTASSSTAFSPDLLDAAAAGSPPFFAAFPSPDAAAPAPPPSTSSAASTPFVSRARSQTFPISAASLDSSSYASTPPAAESAALSFFPGPVDDVSAHVSGYSLGPVVGASAALGISGAMGALPPSVEETQRALQVVWEFLRSQGSPLEPGEVAALRRLMEKLQVGQEMEEYEGKVYGGRE